MIGAVALTAESTIVDVGGGASSLVDRLLDRGFERITVVDISEPALAAARARLGPRAERVTWVTADVRSLSLPHAVDLWHDRAVFHFLTGADDQEAYLRGLRASVRPGGHVVLATFGPEGPDRCSGLPVERYDAAALVLRLGPEFELLRSVTTEHTTPAGMHQQFTHGLFRRRA